MCDTQSSCRIGKEGKGYLISPFMLIFIYYWKNAKLVIMQEKSGFCGIWVFIYLIYFLYWSLGGAIRDCVRQTSVFHRYWLLLWLVHCGYLSVVTSLHCTWMTLGSFINSWTFSGSGSFSAHLYVWWKPVFTSVVRDAAFSVVDSSLECDSLNPGI